MLFADTLVILDNLYGRAILLATEDVPPGASHGERVRHCDAADARLTELAQRLAAPSRAGAPAAADGVTAGCNRVALRPRSVSARRGARAGYIAAGDVFQTVLSRRQEALGAVDPLRLYRYLRALNPAPYLFYLALDDFAFLGSSPEVLVRVEGGEVTVRPIAGTRPRGATPEADEALAAELRADAKERAEHMMLVDLGRNDVGRVAEFGSVRVTEMLALERYSHVQHLVSEVRGRLRPGYDALDALQSLLPRRHRDRGAQGPGDGDHR